MPDKPYNSERMEQLVAPLSDSLVRVSPSAIPLIELKYQNHLLPGGFIWFCRHFTNHSGWPALPAWDGLLSPLGTPSDLQLDNDQRRANIDWPADLVSFFRTDDGVYCFQYGTAPHPSISYVDDWNPIGEQTSIDSIPRAATFEDWFSEMVRFQNQQ